MKKVIAFVIVFVLIFSSSGFAAMAVNEDVNQSVIYLDDGWYLIRTVKQDNSIITRARGETSGSVTVSAYNGLDQLVADVTVIGSFEYNGQTAEAVSASYDYTIYLSGWYLKSGRAYCDGADAIADVTFAKTLMRDVNIIAYLSCSPTGVLY